MTSSAIFLVESASAMAAFFLVARWFVLPYLASQTAYRAMSLLLLPHFVHHIGLATAAPSVVGLNLPAQFAVTVCVGDTAVLVLALSSVWALRRQSVAVLPLLWSFTIVGVFYNAYAGYLGTRLPQLVDELGPHWYIGTVYVPLLLMSHVLVLWNLLRRQHELHPV